MNTYKVTWEFYKDDEGNLRQVGSYNQNIQADCYLCALEIAGWIHSAYTSLHGFSKVVYIVNHIWS